MLTKFATPNKFAAKWFVFYLAVLNNVSTLPCEPWNAYCARATNELSQKKTAEFSNCNCGFQIRQIWIQLTTACEKYCKIRCKNTHHWSGAINDAIDEWLPQWRHDRAWSTPFSVAVSIIVQVTDAYFVHLLLQYFPHAVINGIQMWRIWGLQLKWDKFWSFLVTT